LWRYGMALNCLTSQKKSGNQPLQPIAARWAAPGELFVGINIIDQTISIMIS
jgi:hypothetical protein